MTSMRRIIALMLLAACSSIASCNTMQPDGPLKSVVDGEIFTGDPASTTVAPPRHENDMLVKPEDLGGPVRWKMRF
jgi:hypothetical protein